MGLVKAVSCGLLGSKGQVEAICVLVDAVNLCGLEEAVWLWGNISHMWATGGYMGLHNMYLVEAVLYMGAVLYTYMG